MRYPNSVSATVGGVESATFGAKPQPVPRPLPRRPPGPQPRRKPGRPQPKPPRRPPAPAPRPAPRPAPPRPSPPGAPSYPPSQHPPEKTPGLNYKNPPFRPGIKGGLPAPLLRALRLARVAGRIAGPLGTAMLVWDISQMANRYRGDVDEVTLPWTLGLHLWSFDPEYGAIAGVPGRRDLRIGTSSANIRRSGGPPGLNELVWAFAASSFTPLFNQANVNQWLPPGSSFYEQGLLDVVNVGANFPVGVGNTDRLISIDIGQPGIGALNAHTVATYVQLPGYDAQPIEPIPHYVPGTAKPPLFTFPMHGLGWQFGDYPLFQPVTQPAFSPAPRPIWWSPPRPHSPTPEGSTVGNGTAPKPQPETFPEGATSYTPNSPPKPVQPTGPQPPGPRTKERKGRMGPVASRIWHSVGPITEGNDLIKIVYEALPKAVKVNAYKKYGRQPTPQEKLQLIYANATKLDMGKIVTGYIENQIEDYILGKFGKALGQASKNSDRPIGYGAGFAL